MQPLLFGPHRDIDQEVVALRSTLPRLSRQGEGKAVSSATTLDGGRECEVEDTGIRSLAAELRETVERGINPESAACADRKADQTSGARGSVVNLLEGPIELADPLIHVASRNAKLANQGIPVTLLWCGSTQPCGGHKAVGDARLTREVVTPRLLVLYVGERCECGSLDGPQSGWIARRQLAVELLSLIHI